MSLIRKLLAVNIWNFAYSLFSFLSNFIIARILGVSFFGEFSIISVYIAVMGLVFILIPPNSAVFEYQDSDKFKNIYFSFFLVASFLYSALLAIICFFSNEINLSVCPFLIYAVSLMWYNYVDVTYQATGRLKKYFMILAFSSIAKCLLIIAFYYLQILSTIDSLLWAMAIPQVFFLALALYRDIGSQITNIIGPQHIVAYLDKNIRKYLPYYLNSSLKRLQDQSSIFLFNFFITKEQLGVFSLLIKALTFVVSLLRTVEAYFVNRSNFGIEFSIIKRRQYLLAFSAQFFFIVFASAYMYLMLSQYFFLEILVLSMFLFFYVPSLLVRAELLAKYNMKNINISQILYLLSIIIFTVGFRYAFGVSLLNLTILYVLTNFVQQLTLLCLNPTKDVSS